MARRPRTELQTLLESITPQVYFQPGTNVKLVYPCIVYHRDTAKVQHADDSVYRFTQRYQVTVMDRNPDSVIAEHVGELPMCTANRWFASGDLNHDVFNLYF